LAVSYVPYLLIIITPHRSTTYVYAAYCYRPSSVVCRSVCLSACHTSEPCKNGFTDPAVVWGGVAGSPSSRMWSGPRPTSIPSGILIHAAVWPQDIGRNGSKIGGSAPFWGGELGPHLAQWCFLKVKNRFQKSKTFFQNLECADAGCITCMLASCIHYVRLYHDCLQKLTKMYEFCNLQQTLVWIMSFKIDLI